MTDDHSDEHRGTHNPREVAGSNAGERRARQAGGNYRARRAGAYRAQSPRPQAPAAHQAPCPAASQASRTPQALRPATSHQRSAHHAGPETSYSRDPQTGEVLIKKRRKRKDGKRWKKVVAIVAAVLLVAVVGVGAAGALYYNSIQGNISYDGDKDALQGALTEDDNYEEPFYALVIGSDNWEDYGARSDAMMLCRVDLNKPQITMVTIPRDTPYQLNGSTVKLNEVYAQQGEVACVEAVSQLTGVPIAHYVEIEFDQLEQVVDSMGGIMVDVPYAIDYTVYTHDRPTVHIDAGEQLLNGEQAVALARMRTAYGEVTDSQDALRQANIRAMMVSMMKNILDSPVGDIPGKIQTLAGMVQTDIPLSDLIGWATDLAQKPSMTLYSCTGPYEGGIDDATGLWLTTEAPEQWAALMDVVDSGGDPSTIMGEGSLDAGGSVDVSSTETIDTGADDASAESPDASDATQ